MFNSNVQPKRRIRARPTAWHCACRKPDGTRKLNDAQLTRCPVCGSARHDESAVNEGARVTTGSFGRHGDCDGRRDPHGPSSPERTSESAAEQLVLRGARAAQ